MANVDQLNSESPPPILGESKQLEEGESSPVVVEQDGEPVAEEKMVHLPVGEEPFDLSLRELDLFELTVDGEVQEMPEDCEWDGAKWIASGNRTGTGTMETGRMCGKDSVNLPPTKKRFRGIESKTRYDPVSYVDPSTGTTSSLFATFEKVGCVEPCRSHKEKFRVDEGLIRPDKAFFSPKLQEYCYLVEWLSKDKKMKPYYLAWIPRSRLFSMKDYERVPASVTGRTASMKNGWTMNALRALKYGNVVTVAGGRHVFVGFNYHREWGFFGQPCSSAGDVEADYGQYDWVFHWYEDIDMKTAASELLLTVVKETAQIKKEAERREKNRQKEINKHKEIELKVKAEVHQMRALNPKLALNRISPRSSLLSEGTRARRLKKRGGNKGNAKEGGPSCSDVVVSDTKADSKDTETKRTKSADGIRQLFPAASSAPLAHPWAVPNDAAGCFDEAGSTQPADSQNKEESPKVQEVVKPDGKKTPVTPTLPRRPLPRTPTSAEKHRLLLADTRRAVEFAVATIKDCKDTVTQQTAQQKTAIENFTADLYGYVGNQMMVVVKDAVKEVEASRVHGMSKSELKSYLRRYLSGQGGGGGSTDVSSDSGEEGDDDEEDDEEENTEKQKLEDEENLDDELLDEEEDEEEEEDEDGGEKEEKDNEDSDEGEGDGLPDQRDDVEEDDEKESDLESEDGEDDPKNEDVASNATTLTSVSRGKRKRQEKEPEEDNEPEEYVKETSPAPSETTASGYGTWSFLKQHKGNKIIPESAVFDPTERFFETETFQNYVHQAGIVVGKTIKSNDDRLALARLCFGRTDVMEFEGFPEHLEEKIKKARLKNKKEKLEFKQIFPEENLMSGDDESVVEPKLLPTKGPLGTTAAFRAACAAKKPKYEHKIQGNEMVKMKEKDNESTVSSGSKAKRRTKLRAEDYPKDHFLRAHHRTPVPGEYTLSSSYRATALHKYMPPGWEKEIVDGVKDSVRQKPAISHLKHLILKLAHQLVLEGKCTQIPGPNALKNMCHRGISIIGKIKNDWRAQLEQLKRVSPVYGLVFRSLKARPLDASSKALGIKNMLQYVGQQLQLSKYRLVNKEEINARAGQRERAQKQVYQKKAIAELKHSIKKSAAIKTTAPVKPKKVEPKKELPKKNTKQTPIERSQVAKQVVVPPVKPPSKKIKLSHITSTQSSVQQTKKGGKKVGRQSNH